MKTTLKQYLARLKARIKDQRGLGLAESVVAVAIVGVAIVIFVTALSAGSIGVREGDQQVLAQSLARTQLEEIKAATYDTSYPAIDTPKGYTISIGITSIPYTDTDIQKITVTIWQDINEILTVEDYKVNR